MITNNLKVLRKAVGLSQTEAADRLGISRMELYRIETGKKDLPLSLVFRMLHVYHVLPHRFCVSDLYELYPGSFGRFAAWSRLDFMKRHKKPLVHGTPEPLSTNQGALNHTNNTEVSHAQKAVHDDEDDMPP